MNTEPPDLSIPQIALGIGPISTSERIELNSVVGYRDDEPLRIGRHGHVNDVLLLILEGIVDDVVEQIVENDAHTILDLVRKMEAITKFFERAQATIDLRQFVRQVKFDLGSIVSHIPRHIT